jgi:pimeloyl-ACP methyl ester carboxylesterase
MEPELVVTMIHGTFAKNAPWTQPDSPFSKALSVGFKGRITLKPFIWSGANSLFGRISESMSLAEHLKQLQFAYPYARQVLIAHSHGGNVALYALQQLPDGNNVDGVACLGTPFLHATPRTTSPAIVEYLRSGVHGFLFLLLVAYSLIFRLGPMWTLAMLVPLSIIGSIVGALLSAAARPWSEGNEEWSDLLTADVPSHLNRLIVRKTGDEASMALAGAQFFSWATSRIFRGLAAREARVSRRFLTLGFRREPVPKKWCRLLWWISGISAVGLLIGLATHYSVVGPARFSEDPAPSLAILILASILLLFMARVAAVLTVAAVKTTVLDSYFAGLALLSLLVSYVLVSAWAGLKIRDLKKTWDFMTTDSTDDFKPSRFMLGLLRILIPFSMDLHTEATPPGAWVVYQFSGNPTASTEEDRGLVHSMYDDPRVHTLVIGWLNESVVGIASSSGAKR